MVSAAVETNAFQFNVEWAGGQTLKVQASARLDEPFWEDVGTYATVNGSCVVRDTNWVNGSQRTYRMVSP